VLKHIYTVVKAAHRKRNLNMLGDSSAILFTGHQTHLQYI